MKMEIIPNQNQLQIIDKIGGIQIIIAGPGTGKTATLVFKINKLINEINISPSNILVLTFTNKAVGEINQRLNFQNFAYTFHSFCSYILSSKNITYKIIPDHIHSELIQKLSEKYNLSSKEIKLNITKYKNLSAYELDKKIINEYEKEMLKTGYWDYDDLLVKTFNLLKNEDPIQKQKLKRYKYIFIDEFQDTSKIQYELVKLFLTNATSLCVIGDPNQSIYSFRGATPAIFNFFKKDFPYYKEYYLDLNYRSADKIIDLANQIYPEHPILSTHKKTCEIVIVNTLNEYTQANRITDFITSKIGGTSMQNASGTSEKVDKNVNFSDFAIIYRNHSHRKEIKSKLFEQAVPYQVLGEESLFNREETYLIYTIILKLLNNTPMDMDDDQTQLMEGLDLSLNFVDFTKKILDKLNFAKSEGNQEYLFDFNQLIKEIGQMENPYQKFIEYYEYMLANDSYDEKANKINLLTMHSAKGLEFKYVFLCFFNEKIIPSLVDSEDDKRLFYVTISRAKKGLYLICPKYYKKHEMKISSYEKYLNNLGIYSVDDENMQKDQKRMEKIKYKKSQIKLF